eukprot:scaffold122832_cov30-Tisochrysis_lutea.AAC.3
MLQLRSGAYARGQAVKAHELAFTGCRSSSGARQLWRCQVVGEEQESVPPTLLVRASSHRLCVPSVV